jgi:alkylated DNA nucleotide flippase Atl1
MVSPTTVHAHVNGSSKPSVIEIISVYFPRPPNTTDLPWARMTTGAGRHILPHDWNLKCYEKVRKLLQEELSNTELRTQLDLMKQKEYCDGQF